jgi:hypothetical protein
MIFGNVILSEPIFDYLDDSLFENWYGCEKDENGYYRWAGNNSILHLEKWGGYQVVLTILKPRPLLLIIKDCKGEEIAHSNENEDYFEYGFRISHNTRSISFTSDRTWIPSGRKSISDVLKRKKVDTRRLSFMLRNVRLSV